PDAERRERGAPPRHERPHVRAGLAAEARRRGDAHALAQQLRRRQRLDPEMALALDLEPRGPALDEEDLRALAVARRHEHALVAVDPGHLALCAVEHVLLAGAAGPCVRAG